MCGYNGSQSAFRKVLEDAAHIYIYTIVKLGIF